MIVRIIAFRLKKKKLKTRKRVRIIQNRIRKNGKIYPKKNLENN